MNKLIILPLFLAYQSTLTVQPATTSLLRPLCTLSQRSVGIATGAGSRRSHGDQTTTTARLLPLGCSVSGACRNLQALKEQLKHHQVHAARVAKGRDYLKAQGIEPDQAYFGEPQKMALICDVEAAEIALIKSMATVRAMKLAIMHCQAGAAAGSNRCVLQGMAVATLTADGLQSVPDHRD